MSKKLFLTLALCLLAATGCNVVYKQNIQQGNAIEQDKLDQLKLGMTMNQVAFLLGTPAIRDPFHQDRWDYYYSFSIRGGDPIERLVTLRFENAILNEYSGADFDDPDAVVSADDEPIDDELANEDAAAQAETVPAEPEITAVETPVNESVAATGTEMVVDTIPESEPEPELEEAVAVAVEVPAAEESPAEWIIQLGVFESLQNAENLVARMEQQGLAGNITHQQVAHLGDRYLVRSMGFESKEQAQRQLEMINSALELDAFLIPPSN